MSRLISDDLVDQALHTISTTAEATAAARAIRLRCEFRRKTVRARLIRQSNEKTAELRSAYAESDGEYLDACREECEAVERDEFLRASRNDAATIISAWQTEESSRRAGGDFR
jgi:hypothetical protein